MALITIETNALDGPCISNCIQQLRRLDVNRQHELRISLTREIFDLDIQLIGYLILFKRQFKDLNIKVIVNQDKAEKSSASINFLNTLAQSAAYSTLAFGSKVFHYQFSKNNEHNPPERPLGMSNKIIPLIFITDETYGMFFELLNANFFVANVDLQDSSNDIFKKIKDELLDLVNKNLNQQLKVTYLASLAFHSILYEAKILKAFYTPKGQEFECGHLQKEMAKTYLNSVGNLIKSLKHQPPLFYFIYSTLLSSELLPGSLDKDSSDSFVSVLYNLFSFTQEIFYGLNELAKNIIEHSTTKAGVITGRIIKRQSGSFFEFNVADLGRDGIVKTLQKQLLNDEFEGLETGIKLQDLLDPQNGQLLFFQAKRATAHLGLLILSKLIEINSAILVVTSWKSDRTNKQMEEREGIFIGSPIYGTYVFNAPVGTNFSFILPIAVKREYRPHLPQQPIVFLDTSPFDIAGIEDFLSYELIDEPKTIVDNNKKAIYSLKPVGKIFTRVEEAKLFRSILDKIQSNWSLTDIVSINMSELSLNGSALFRFLGNWEMSFPGRPVIIYNIQSKLLGDLLRINESYCSKFTELPYWNENSLILFYSSLEVEMGKFFFTDVLWGKTRDDLLYINKLIARTNFNSITLANTPPAKITRQTDLMLKRLERFRVFYKSTTLYPFDLMLQSENNLTLFESNASVLLQNELMYSSWKG